MAVNASHVLVAGQSRSGLRRVLRSAGVVLTVLAVAVWMVAAPSVRVTHALASSTAVLVPADGQFVSVPITRVLDTRFGTGGVPTQPIPAGGTVTFPVAGVFGVPGDADSVVLTVSALNPTAVGYLTAYNADAGDPGVATVGIRASKATSQTATISVSDSGSVSLTNHSSAAVDAVASVFGYYTEPDAAQPGDTYQGVPWNEIGGTYTIPAGSSQTVQVTGQAGVAAGADTAVLQVNTLNASTTGYLTAYATGSTDPNVSALSYFSDTSYRNLLYVPLSASGQVTFTNHGTASVGITVWARGYFLPPSATPAGGEYSSVGSQMVYGTVTAGTQLAANASVSFQVTGTPDIPAAGVAEVTEDVIATNPSAIGNLAEGPAVGQTRPVTSFLNADEAFAGYDNGIVSALSPDGQETITNNSSGTVDVQVEVTGYFLAPVAPGTPDSVSVTTSGTSATVSWTPPAVDGGSPVTGYSVAASPDTSTASVSGGDTSVTITGLANAASDSFTVAATNAIGTSGAASYSPPDIITGTVVRPDGPGTAVPGDLVSIMVNDPNSSSNTPSLLGTATTDASGNWSFPVPAYSALPPDAQAAANANAGYLNVVAIASGQATTANGNQYAVGSVADRSAWVGTSTTTAAPPPGNPPASPAMVLRPDGVDTSGQITSAAEQATYAYSHDATASDASGNDIGNPDDAYDPPPTDSYGYQEIGGNGTYNPNQAADGTDLTNATITPLSSDCCGSKDGCADRKLNAHVAVRHSNTILGEYHSNWDEFGSLELDNGATTEVTSLAGISGSDFGISGWNSVSSGEGTQDVRGQRHTFESNQIVGYMKYVESKWQEFNQDTHAQCYWWYQWDPAGLDARPDGQDPIEYGPGINNHQNSSQTSWHTDGSVAAGNLQNAHPHWLHWLPFGFSKCLYRDKGTTYGAGAGISYTLPDGTTASLEFETQATHSSADTECFESNASAGFHSTDKRWDNIRGANDGRHYYWGSNRDFSFRAGPQPKVFYTY